jgi:YesN/AraC family two-component response regulator
VKRLLFVDDDRHVLEGLRRLLRSRRHEWDMVFATSGSDALVALEQQPAHVVVSDLRMPGMDGGELMRAVQERWPETVRIVLSGQADKADLGAVLPVVHEFLHKPCDPEVLEAALDNAVSRADERDEARS